MSWRSNLFLQHVAVISQSIMHPLPHFSKKVVNISDLKKDIFSIDNLCQIFQ